MKEEILCECGMIIIGTSKKHLAHNLREHKKSKVHKKIVQAKKGIKKNVERLWKK